MTITLDPTFTYGKRAGKPRCQGQTFGSWHTFQCERGGTIVEDGTTWCHSHAPSLVQARKDANTAKWKAEYASREARFVRLEAKREEIKLAGIDLGEFTLS